MSDGARLPPFLLSTTASLSPAASPPSPFAFPSISRRDSSPDADDTAEEPELEPTGPIRMISATVGALITSFVVTPFDVIKTRLQAQPHPLHPHNQQPPTATTTPSPPSASPSSSSFSSSSTPTPHQRQPQPHYPYAHSHPQPRAASRSSNLVSHPLAQSSSVRPMAVSFSPHLSTAALLERCSHTRLQTGLMDSWCDRCIIQPPPPRTSLSSTSSLHPSSTLTLPHASSTPLQFTGTFDALTKLIRHEGVLSLWRGLSPQLLLSIPSTVVYFWAYDELKHSLQRLTAPPHTPGLLSPLYPYLALTSPLVAGTSARALTTILVSPIELIRTRTQSLSTSTPMLELARAEVAKGGWRSLWRGANPTLWRDVPFSAFYWTSYEWIKGSMMKRVKRRLGDMRQQGEGDSSGRAAYERSLLWVSFVSGASSGMIAAFFTHPFDLVKTRRQIEMYQLTPAVEGGEGEMKAAKGRTATFQLLRTIVREEGWRALSTGMLARMTKIVPACAIMISRHTRAPIPHMHAVSPLRTSAVIVCSAARRC